MTLEDLFKPNKYGNVPLVTTLHGAVLNLKGNYVSIYRHSEKEYLNKDTELRYIPHKGTYAMPIKNGQELIQVTHLVIATPDNILLNMTLKDN